VKERRVAADWIDWVFPVDDAGALRVGFTVLRRAGDGAQGDAGCGRKGSPPDAQTRSTTLDDDSMTCGEPTEAIDVARGVHLTCHAASLRDSCET
jgi:hypothetical protein